MTGTTKPFWAYPSNNTFSSQCEVSLQRDVDVVLLNLLNHILLYLSSQTNYSFIEKCLQSWFSFSCFKTKTIVACFRLHLPTSTGKWLLADQQLDPPVLTCNCWSVEKCENKLMQNNRADQIHTNHKSPGYKLHTALLSLHTRPWSPYEVRPLPTFPIMFLLALGRHSWPTQMCSQQVREVSLLPDVRDLMRRVVWVQQRNINHPVDF